MLTNGNASVVIDGIAIANPVYKRNDDQTPYGRFYIADGEGSVLGTDCFVVQDTMTGYRIKDIVIHEASVYEISGVAIPGDITVFLSAGYKRADINYLKENIIARAYADAEGNFKFTNVSCQEGIVTMWIAVYPEQSAVASLKYSLKVIDFDPYMGNLLTYSFNEKSGKYTKPFFTITGTCTKDITKIYMSKADNAMSIVYLMENLCGSGDTENGSYKIEQGGEYDQNYILWAVTKKTGSFTVDSILITEDTTTCLSGDTLITMADGSLRRLDSLEVGEEVLSEGGTISKICSVRGGYWSDFHTLYYFEDGTVIDETHPHRFYNTDQGFWQKLQNWKIGEHALNTRGEKIALVDKKFLEEKAEMFGIWTESGVYYANGLLSGAAFCNKKLLEEVSAEQAVDMMLSADEDWLLRLMGLEGELP